MSKNTLLGLLKWIFAIALLVILIRSGKISLSDIQVFLSHPLAALGCLSILLVIYLLAFTRWRLLLMSQGIQISFWNTFKLGMLGQFFSSIIPGTVGGDLVKAVYVARRYPDRKAKTLSTIFLDRLMGLFGLICLGAMFFLGSRGQLHREANTGVVLIESFGWILVSIASVGLIVLMFFPKIGKLLPEQIPTPLRKLPAQGFLESAYTAALSYRDRVSAIWLSLGISLCIHVLSASVLYIIAHTIYGPAPWGNVGNALFIVGSVLGTCAIAVPLAPQGLAVGQYAFSAIFLAMGAPSDQFGSSIITGLQIVTLVLNFSGAIFFATYRHESEALAASDPSPEALSRA